MKEKPTAQAARLDKVFLHPPRALVDRVLSVIRAIEGEPRKKRARKMPVATS